MKPYETDKIPDPIRPLRRVGPCASLRLPLHSKRRIHLSAHAYSGAAVRPCLRAGLRADLRRIDAPSLQPADQYAPSGDPAGYALRTGGLRPGRRTADPPAEDPLFHGKSLSFFNRRHALRTYRLRRAERPSLPGRGVFPANLDCRIFCHRASGDPHPAGFDPPACRHPAKSQAGGIGPLNSFPIRK